jgi:phosphatidylglycerophosphate synthase
MAELGTSTRTRTRALIVGSSTTRIWGLTGDERLRRLFDTKGIPATSIATDHDAITEGESDAVIVIRGDYAFEATLIVNLMANPGTVLCLDDGRPMALHVERGAEAAAVTALTTSSLPPELGASLRVVHPKDLAFNFQLRKRATPYVLPISDAQRIAIEEQVFAGSYKGVTDFVTKHVIPRAVLWLTRVAAALGLRPNHVTTIGLTLTVLATWLFFEGHFGAGLVCAWSMSVLDSVDGKLARVTLDWSKFGDYYDHSIDLIHPPFWYWAWMVGLGASFASHPYAAIAAWAIMAGYLGQRVLEAAFMVLFRIELHIWRPIDSWFRLITARRNPNLVILTVCTAVGRPLEGILLVAVWTVVSLGVHTLQIAHAAIDKARGLPIESWLSSDAAPS